MRREDSTLSPRGVYLTTRTTLLVISGYPMRESKRKAIITHTAHRSGSTCSHIRGDKQDPDEHAFRE